MILDRLQAANLRRRTRRTLRNVADRLMREVLLPDGIGGQIGVNALLLRDGRLYVLGILRADGAIFAGEKMDNWAVIDKQQRDRFRNPLHRMHDQAFALRALTPELPLEPRVLFVGRGYFPKGRPQGVQLFAEFAAPLRRGGKSKPGPLSPELEAAWRRLSEAAGVLPGKETPALGSRSRDIAAT
ncbi:MAG: hypothetical protein ACRETQ_07105 [Gammaproteobacteria bacterium]